MSELENLREGLIILEDLERFLIEDVGCNGKLALDNSGRWAKQVADCRTKIADQKAAIAILEESRLSTS